ncbi:hypothetical protein GCAAIG_02535 [Candidatus Electronema halotolerans]
MKAFFGMTAAVLLVVTMLFVALPGTAIVFYDTNCENNNVVYTAISKIKEKCSVKKCVSNYFIKSANAKVSASGMPLPAARPK